MSSISYSLSNDSDILLSIKLERNLDSTMMIMKRKIAIDYIYSEEKEIITFKEIIKNKKIENSIFDDLIKRISDIDLNVLVNGFSIGRDGNSSNLSIEYGSNNLSIRVWNLSKNEKNHNDILGVIKKILELSEIKPDEIYYE